MAIRWLTPALEFPPPESADDEGVVVHMKSGKKMRSDVLLWANGRTGNTQDMALESLGVRLDARGQIKVNESYQTDLPHIYAVGDVIGPPSLATDSSFGPSASSRVIGPLSSATDFMVGSSAATRPIGPERAARSFMG